jgi:hypothetical protein
MNKILNKMIAAIGVAFIVIGGMTSANATGVAASGADSISVGASATSIDDCNWYFSGVGDGGSPYSLTLTNPNGDDYIGDALSLTGTDTGLSIYLSGSATAADDCSFYGQVLGSTVNVTWSGSGFAATGPDDNLDWDLVDSPLSLTIDDSNVCMDWTKTVASLNSNGTSETRTPLTIANTALSTYDPVGEIGAPTFPACSFDVDYSTAIPSGRIPDDGGSLFTFTGPTVTLTLVINSNT